MISTNTPYKLADIIRDTWPQLYRPSNTSYNNQKNLNYNMDYNQLLKEDIVIFTFPVLWHEWECDGTAWIMERPDGTRYLKMTNHGGAYEANALELKERISYYEEVIKEFKTALGILNEKV